MRKLFIFSTLLAMSFLTTQAGGYQVRLQSNRSTGMGLTGTAFQMGASSMFYNPGALSMMNTKTDFSLGVSGIISKISFQKTGSNFVAETDNDISTPFYVYGAGKINEKWAVGLAIYTPYGSSSAWENNWSGRLLIQNIALQAIFFQPTLSYKFSEKLGVGAGLVYTTGSVKLQKGLNYGPDTYAKLDGSASGIGFNLGVFYEASDKLSVGINYRSEITMDVADGDAQFNVPASVGTSIPAENKFSASLPLPANFDFGLSFQASEKLLLAAEINWVMWSTYESLEFSFEQQGELLNSTNPRNYKDTFIPRIGAEYRFNDLFTFRAGAYYDQSPANEDYFTPETVSLDNVAFTLGLSIQPTERLSIDLSYLQISGLEAQKNYQPDQFGGTYKSAAFIPGFGLTYRF
ncbi:MAG: outer membrane protein transport protein [Bacteroidetes bacterium]|nr:outer membrane protein transport protein [Bacteroidota bacterium]MBU1580815.1 outer membrane protein transport protein [Bacteroidota bacterium]MBU2465745.1 outer membrane protein transport protein [Bacteroidota bacterium]MBU2557842.1 outer membrane protein transport protein [Bacteroidota bacterium]